VLPTRIADQRCSGLPPRGHTFPPIFVLMVMLALMITMMMLLMLKL